MSFLGRRNIFGGPEPRKKEFVIRMESKSVWLNIVSKGEKYMIRKER